MKSTVAEQLTAHIAKHYPHHVSQSAGKPWTFHYRQWVDEGGQKCAQCTGVTIDFREGPSFTHHVSDMDIAMQQLSA